MLPFKKLDSEVEKIISDLKKKEKSQDAIIPLSREAVRGCSRSIKAIHSDDLEKAGEELKKVEELMKKIKKHEKGFENIASTANQEYCEAKLLMAVIRKKSLPGHKELGIPYTTYLNGLCDLVGELRREMLESLKKGNREAAEYYFDIANGVYKSLMPIRFSNSLLPGFRRKQDVARVQLEQARSELLR